METADDQGLQSTKARKRFKTNQKRRTKRQLDNDDVNTFPGMDMDTKQRKQFPPFYKRQDVWFWVAGLVFIGLLIGMIYAVGEARGWDASSGFTHNESATSQDRFWPEPYQHEEGVRGRYGVGSVSRWYYWKLPPDQTDFWTHLFPWIGYILHQVLIWAVIYWSQITKAYEPVGKGRYSTNVSGFNWVALGLNMLFHLLHFINTHTTYDATAPDVSIATSQGDGGEFV